MIIMNSIPRTAAELIATVQGMAQACGGRHPSTVYLKTNQSDRLYMSLERLKRV